MNGDKSMSAEKRLQDLGLVLPSPPLAVANYVPAVKTGHLLIVSGQLPYGHDGALSERHKGKLGRDVFNEAGQEAARMCALNVLAQVRAVLGTLNDVRRCVKIGGFVNSSPGFTAIPAVVNGASDLMVAVFGDAGRHARFAVGVAELPLDAAVEIEAMFEVK
jgi:enamine deaminase RidA (YjgF/YER057c/UK114 family)